MRLKFKAIERLLASKLNIRISLKGLGKMLEKTKQRE